MPVLTDTLAEQIAKLADEVRESNRQFGNFRVEVAQELGRVNANMEKELGRVNANMENLKGDVKELSGRFESSLSVARWGGGLLTAVAIVFAAGALGTYREFAEAKQTIDRIAVKLDATAGSTPDKTP